MGRENPRYHPCSDKSALSRFNATITFRLTHSFSRKGSNAEIRHNAQWDLTASDPLSEQLALCLLTHLHNL